MNEETKIDPQHQKSRTFLRTVGPVLIVLGAALIIWGAITMFSPAWSSRGGFSETSRSMFGGFGMCAGGGVCLFVGITMTMLGYLGRVARHVSAEVAPVAKDTFNYVAEGTQQAVGDLAGAIGQSLRGAAPPPSAAPPAARVRCLKCNADNPAGAKFCSQCGAHLL